MSKQNKEQNANSKKYVKKKNEFTIVSLLHNIKNLFQELKELGKPRKPLTAYLKYVTEEIKNHGNEPVQTYMVTVANKWKEMDENQKSKYIESAAIDNENYKNALLKWENDMIKAGRLDLVRARALSKDDTDN